MQTALEAAADLAAFPKATADVYCLVLEAGGSELAVAVTAAALALADAGIPLFDLVSACSVVRLVWEVCHGGRDRGACGWGGVGVEHSLSTSLPPAVLRDCVAA